MLTQTQVVEALKTGRKSECFDGRDYNRLCSFFPIEQWEFLGFKANSEDDLTSFVPIEWNRDEVLKVLKSDLDFAFEKALNRRGLSSDLMYEVIKMWMWILEDDLYSCDEYAMYGLPLFKKVAVKYGFPNEIGDDEGNEGKYDEQY